MKKAAIIAAVCALLLCTGCEKHKPEAQSVCKISIDTLPQAYLDLPEEIRDNTDCTLVLSSAKDSHIIHLNEKNKYCEEVELLPGTYTVSHNSPHLNRLLPPVSFSVSAETLTAKPRSQSCISVTLDDPDTLVQQIQSSLPCEEILNASPFSRQIQYRDRVYSLDSLQESVHFSARQDLNVQSGETAGLVSDSHPGLVMIVKNQNDSGVLPVSQCTCIGYRLTNFCATLSGGAAPGQSYKQLVHSKEGLLGTPDYCLGTPLIGAGLESTTLVYLDPDSGDRISAELDSSSGCVRSISYEFNQYV